MNDKQISDMKHAIKNGRFYTDSDDPDWLDLVIKGYAQKLPGWDEESSYFIPTYEGKMAIKREEKK